MSIRQHSSPLKRPYIQTAPIPTRTVAGTQQPIWAAARARRGHRTGTEPRQIHSIEPDNSTHTGSGSSSRELDSDDTATHGQRRTSTTSQPRHSPGRHSQPPRHTPHGHTQPTHGTPGIDTHTHKASTPAPARHQHGQTHTRTNLDTAQPHGTGIEAQPKPAQPTAQHRSSTNLDAPKRRNLDGIDRAEPRHNRPAQQSN